MKVEKYKKELICNLRGVQIHATVANAVCAAVSMIIPFLMSKVIDNLSNGVFANVRLGILIIIFAFLSFALNWYQNYHWFKMIYKGQSFLRGAIFEGVVATPYHFLCNRKSGDVTNRLINDAAQYAEYSLISIPMLILNSLSLGLAFAFIFYYSIPIGLVIFLICFAYFFSYKYINIKLRKYSQEERKGYSELMQTTTRFYDGIPTIRLFGKEKYFAIKYKEKAEELGKRNIRLQLWKSLALSLSGLIIDLMPIAAIIIGMLLMMEGKCSIGAIFGIYAYTAYLGAPIRNLTDLNLSVQQGKVNKERLEEVLAEEKSKNCFEDKMQSIVLKDISFSYVESETILEKFSMSICRGERIGIVGNSGSGKTTLAHVLSGELRPTSGEIFVNGQEVEIEAYRTRIAVLPQDIFLYDESVMNNILFGREGMVSQKILETLEIDKFADREVAELSGGEKRRVGLGRALAGDFDLLILDEPTAEIDAVMEEKIVKFVHEIIDSEKMMIVITHRPRILDICTRTLEIGAEN